MKSNRKKRIIAAILCMVLVVTSNISALAGEEIFVDMPAAFDQISSESVSEELPADVFVSDEESDMTMEETVPEFESPEVVEIPDETQTEEQVVTEAPTDVFEEADLFWDFGDGTTVVQKVFSEATELRQDFTDEAGNVVQTVRAKLPAGAFEAETSAVTMEVTYPDASAAEYMRSLMEARLPEGMQTGGSVFFNIQFKVNGQQADALKPITIIIEGSNLAITDTRKANVVYFDPAAEGTADQLAEIYQRTEVMEGLQASGQSTENIEDYDLSEVTFREDGTADKIIFEGRKSTIYGCYVEEEKPVEEVPSEPTPTPEAEVPSEPTPTPEAEVPSEPTPTPEAEVPSEPTPTPEVPSEDGNADVVFEDLKKIEVITDEANVRETPSVQAAVLTTILKGVQLDVLEETVNEEGLWYKIQYEGTEGYISEQCVAEVSTAPEVITRYDYRSDLVNVLVTLTDPADLPDHAELSVTPVTISEEAESQIEEEAIKEKKSIEKIIAYDIKFLVDGQEIQPGATVNVQVSTPEIQAGQQAAVYHVNEQDVVENMDGTVDAEGNVSFDTPHFSVYVIVQQGTNEVTVTVEHYDSTQNPAAEIYQKDVLTLPVGGKINNYAKAINWDVAKVVEVAEDGTETDVDTSKEILVSADKTFRVYYTPKKSVQKGAVSFYDYTMKAGSYTYRDPNTGKQVTKNYSINAKENYGSASEAPNKLAVGDDDWVYDEHKGNSNGYICNVGGKNANNWLGRGVNRPEQMIKGLVSGLDSQGNVVFSVPEPGLFENSDLTFEDPDTKETRYLRKYYKDYQLEFNQTGDFYKLSGVYDGAGNKVASAGANFWPMDSVKPNYPKFGDTQNNQNNNNLYFGMRYDVNFKIGDYMGPLNYKFSGDDDLVVLLDGKQAVIDLGGIHDACTDHVDLWNYILAPGQTVSDLTIEQKEQEHTLTILYMERGGYLSNCDMEFTLPSAHISEVTNVPMAELVLKKVNKDNEPLAGARFTLTDSNGNIVASATSTQDGAVKFSKLREGTYTLTEDAAPTGYIPTLDSWIVKVEVNKDGAAVATLYLSDGKTEYSKKTGSVYDILNITKQELIDSAMEYNKTAHVKDWDKRTYDITITAASKLTSSTTEEVGGVADVMMVFDTSGSMLYDNDEGDKNGFQKPSGIKYNSYNACKDKLDTTKLYYYGYETKKVSYNGYEYYNAMHPMIYMNGKWQYYDSGSWRVIRDSSSTKIYTIDSNMSALKESATTFINSTALSSPDSRLGIATFNSNGELKQKLTRLDRSAADQMVKTVSALTASAGTSPQLGLKLAHKQLLEGRRENIPQYVILFSDGSPSTEEDKKLSKSRADEIKQNGILIYTIGLGDAANQKWLREKIASKDCAFSASNVGELKEIFKKIQQTITQNPAINKAQIRDVVDPRFVILDDKGTPITEDYPGIAEGVKLANGGIVTYVEIDGKMCQQIIWAEQTIPNKVNGSWNQTFTVIAKEEYIGGNNITTNISPDSSISTDAYGEAILPQPTVNVKADLLVKDKEVTIYYGDKVPTEEAILNTLFDKNDPTGYVTLTDGTKKLVHYTMGTDGNPLKGADGILIDPNDITLTWYEDQECTVPVTPEQMAQTIPEPTEKKYYLKVTYNKIGESTINSGNNTDQHIAVGNAYNEKDPALDHGIYTIHVISGEIQITKNIDTPSDKDETFRFTIHRVEGEGEQKTEIPVAEAEVQVKAGQTTASYTYIPAAGASDPLKGLKRGTYIVREADNDSFDVQDIVIDTRTDCESSLEQESAVFVLGNDTQKMNVITPEYTYTKDGVLGAVSFTNGKVMKNWQIIKTSTSDPGNKIRLQGAEFKLTPKTENSVQKTYLGISEANGVVKWYETDAQGNKGPEVTKFAAGFYELKETKAPAGYGLSTETWTVRLSAKGYLISIEGAGTENPQVSVENGKMTYQFYFKNTPFYDLPSSGGNGIYVYMIGGVALMMAAMLILYKMKCKGVRNS